jgi:hypothetical protein
MTIIAFADAIGRVVSPLLARSHEGGPGVTHTPPTTDTGT